MGILTHTTQSLAHAQPPGGDVAALRFAVKRVGVTDYLKMSAAFADLSSRAADANPHMSPASVMAAATLLDADDIVILAVMDAASNDALIGSWAFSLSRPAWAMGMPVLSAPMLPLYEVLSLPVIDAAQLEPVLAVMLAHISADPLLPKLIRCTTLTTDSLTGQVLMRLMSLHRGQITFYESWQRAILMADPGLSADNYLRASMGNSYKNYTAKRRALERSGTVTFAMHKGEAAIAALPRFLALEASGWKGKAGTAMASIPQHAEYAKALVNALASQNEIMVAELALDGIPVSMGLLPSSSGISCFIKAAYDENARKYAPGFQLQMEVTKALMQEPEFRLMDSGMDDSGDINIMVWSQRRAMAHGLLALGSAPAAWLAAHGLALRQRLRSVRKQAMSG